MESSGALSQKTTIVFLHRVCLLALVCFTLYCGCGVSIAKPFIGYGSIESLGPSILAGKYTPFVAILALTGLDLFYERNYSSAMAIYAAFLSGGSQIGPVIAGYLIEAKGWRWFFILCAIIAAVNLITTVFLLPETLYEVEPEPELVNDIEKDVHSHVENVTRSDTRTEGREKMDYHSYWKGLWSFEISKKAKEKGVIKYFAYLFILPFPLLLIPGVLIASAMYGVILGA